MTAVLLAVLAALLLAPAALWLALAIAGLDAVQRRAVGSDGRPRKPWGCRTCLAGWAALPLAAGGWVLLGGGWRVWLAAWLPAAGLARLVWPLAQPAPLPAPPLPPLPSG